MAVNAVLLKKALERISDKCLLVNGAARRTAELSRGARPLVPVVPQENLSPLDIALREIGEERIRIVRKRGTEAGESADADKLPTL